VVGALMASATPPYDSLGVRPRSTASFANFSAGLSCWGWSCSWRATSCAPLRPHPRSRA
jgi:hypothetical protein